MKEVILTNASSITLTASQKEAVQCGKRYIAVIAGPGSGKTRVLTERVVHLVQEKNTPSESILALSFSSKAANEVRKRLRDRLGHHIWKVSVKTFHSFGLDVIRQNADLLGYQNDPDILNDTEKYRILRRILQEKQSGNQSVSLAHIQRYAQEISRIKGGFPSNDMHMHTLITAYNAELKRGNYLDFDDMILLCRKLLTENKALRTSYQEKYTHILVDEVQDLNAYQTDIIRRLIGKNTCLFVVGDDDQCIYEWRGAVPDFLKGLASNNAFHTIHLDDNFRSDRAIVTASSSFIDRNTNRIKKSICSKKISKTTVKPTATTFAYRLQSAESEAAFIAQTIKNETQNRIRSYSDFAILIRNHSQSKAISEALTIAEIPYSYQTDDGAIYDEFLPVLRAVADIRNKNNINRAINYPIRIIDNFSYMDIKEKYPQLEEMTVYQAFEWLHDNNCQFEDSDLFHARYGMLTSVHRQAHVLSASAVVKRLYDYYSSEKSHSPNIKEKLSFISNLIEMASDFDKGYSPSKDNSASAINCFLDYLNLSMQDTSVEANSLCVNLMTCHRSKGLEFPVVFIPGVQVKYSKEPAFINPEFINSHDDLEAERRLFYVSMTRAIDCLYITCFRDPYAGNGSIVKKGFLAELPDIVLKIPGKD